MVNSMPGDDTHVRFSNGITVYIAAPYISDPIPNTLRAMALWHQLYELGYEPFCPHLYHHMDRSHRLTQEEWLEHDLVWQAKADVTIRSIPGHSNGADREELRAIENGQPIVYSVKELEEWRLRRETKTAYVIGLAFNVTGQYVALIHKNRGPAAVIGNWNGLGGKIEPNENPTQAMAREFREESGVVISDWRELGVLETGDYILHFLTARSDEIFSCRSLEGEQVTVFQIDSLPEPIMTNITWMIPFALDEEVESWGKIPLVRQPNLT